MVELGRGALDKMAARLDAPVQYAFRLGELQVPVNPLIGKTLRLEYLGAIHCSHCGRKTNKSFSQGYCYPCFKKLPQCDLCIVSPEKCHHELGTCRDPEWGTSFCMTDHVVYLANSSGIKVGITRATQLPTRWLDQGATQALPNGFCGLPVQKNCPHANACLTCPMFITTAEFLPQHRLQHQQVLQIITAAEARGQTRLIQMNRQVAANLEKIITTLENDQPQEVTDAS